MKLGIQNCLYLTNLFKINSRNLSLLIRYSEKECLLSLNMVSRVPKSVSNFVSFFKKKVSQKMIYF